MPSKLLLENSSISLVIGWEKGKKKKSNFEWKQKYHCYETKPVTTAIQHRGSTLDTAEMYRKILETGKVCVRVAQFWECVVVKGKREFCNYGFRAFKEVNENG